MRRNGVKKIAVVLGFSTVSLLAGCHKVSTTAKAEPAPAPPPAPTVSLTASPNRIERGQVSQLTWHTDNATDVTIEGLGTVPRSGERPVSPTDTTTYRLLAKGPGGTGDASASVTVYAPAPAPIVSPQAQVSEEELFSRNMHDIFFDYNKHDIRADETQFLQSDAGFLQQHPDVKILIEGHCDERGSEEYNLSLGDERANAVKDSLVRLGIPIDRVQIVSYGKERPFCTDENEACWQKNRRGHFVFEHTTSSANRSGSQQ